MKHDTDYKFSDEIKSVLDFRDALGSTYSLGLIERRCRNDKLDCYLLSVYSDGDRELNVQYEIYELDDCLKITTSRIDFMYHLAMGGYLVAVD